MGMPLTSEMKERHVTLAGSPVPLAPRGRYAICYLKRGRVTRNWRLEGKKRKVKARA
jgi:hypothetical protein